MLVYEHLQGNAAARAVLQTVGPLWELEARAPDPAGSAVGTILPHRPGPRRDGLDGEAWKTDRAAGIRSITARGLAACLGAEVVAGLVGFFGTIWVARRVGPEGFASLEVAAAVAGWLLVLVRGGLDQIVIREAARKPRLIRRLTGELLGLRCAWAALGIGLVAASGGRGVLIAASLVLLPSALIADVGPRARNELGLLALIQLVRSLGLVAFVILVVAGPGDLIVAALAPAVSETLAALVCAARAARVDGWPWPRWRGRTALVLSRRALVAGLTRFGRVGLYAADAIALGLATLGDRGGYAASRRLVFALVAVGLVVPSLLAPGLARAWRRGAHAASAEVGRGLAILLALFVPAALALWGLADLVMPTLFGASYAAASPLLGLAAARLPVLLAATWLQTALVAFGREGLALALTAVAGAFAAVALPIAAVWAGPVGIGWAVIAAEALLAAGGWVALRGLAIGARRSLVGRARG